MVAKPVGLPVREGDFGHGKSSTVVQMNRCGNFFHTEIGDPGFDDSTNAFVFSSIPLQANGLAMGSDMETTCVSEAGVFKLGGDAPDDLVQDLLDTGFGGGADVKLRVVELGVSREVVGVIHALVVVQALP